MEDPRITSLAAGNVSSAAVLASLMGTLVARGVLSNEDIREVHEQALMMLDMVSVDGPEMKAIYDEAKAVIREQLEP